MLRKIFKKSQPVKVDNSFVPCASCGQNVHTKDDVTVVMLGKHHNREWLKVGLKCPHCNHFHFGYYNHDKIEKRRSKLKKMTGTKLEHAKARLKQYHQSVQTAGKILFG